LNPKSIAYDKVSRTTTVPSFKSFRFIMLTYKPTPTYTHTS